LFSPRPSQVVQRGRVGTVASVSPQFFKILLVFTPPPFHLPSMSQVEFRVCSPPLVPDSLLFFPFLLFQDLSQAGRRSSRSPLRCLPVHLEKDLDPFFFPPLRFWRLWSPDRFVSRRWPTGNPFFLVACLKTRTLPLFLADLL